MSLALADRVVLATASYVTGAHLNRIPEEVGVWRFDADSGTLDVRREATPLSTDDRRRTPCGAAAPDGRAHGRRSEKARARRRLAERAYGKGWRASTAAHVSAVRPRDGIPYCQWKDRAVRESDDCGPDCGGHEAADPPAVDGDSLRAERTPWRADPDGRGRRQSGLDRFG